MKFSIIVPVYKVERYLTECIESVLKQSYQDYELILVDDGSPDNCPVICDEYADKDSRVKVIHQKNGGVIKARQSGANIAVGEYIVCLDGDDYWEQDYLQHYADILEQYQVDFVCGGFTKVGENIEKEVSNYFEEGLYEGEKFDLIRQNCIYNFIQGGFNCGAVIYAIWVKVVKAELFRKAHKKIDPKIWSGEDMMLTVNLLNMTSSVYISKFYGYKYRMVSTSVTHSLRRGFVENILRIYDQVAESELKDFFYEQIKCYSVISLFNNVAKYAKELKYGQYLKVIKEEINQKIIDIVKKANIKINTKRDRLKFFLIKHRLWRVLYLLAHR